MSPAPKPANPIAEDDLAMNAGRRHGSAEAAISFGPFRLLPAQRLLLKEDKSVDLGSRALDILIILVERAGEMVSKKELMAQVWPKIFVEPANLTVQISRLRRALGDRPGGNRYLLNIPGRGYRFVAPVDFEENRQATNAHPVAARRSHNVPNQLTKPVGRDQIVSTLAADVVQKRIITLIGPGGIGKSTVGVTVAHGLTSSFAHGIHVIDLTTLSDPPLVRSALASVLGIDARSSNPMPELLAFLGDKQVLLLFDGCEHVITAAASLAVAVLKGTPNVHVLATSREPLHVEGERLCRLPPLKWPPQVPSGITAADAMMFPAVQLFVERTAASLGGYELSDAEAPTVAEICSKLEGIPLAIESAAAQVAAFGLRGLAVQLNDPIKCLTMDRPGMAARQRSLRGSLDWSYHWLTEHERIALRRLAIFSSGVDLQAASTVAAHSERTLSETVECLTGLAKKSLVSVDVSGSFVRYRLLNTTRAYLLEKLKKSGEFDEIARRHAEFFEDSRKHAEANVHDHSDFASNARRQVEVLQGSRVQLRDGVTSTKERPTTVPALRE